MSGPIVTVTLNPAIDQTLVLEQLRVGEGNRVTDLRTDPGGKGINVSRALKELGVDSIATGFAPGSVGHFIERELVGAGIRLDFVNTGGETRTNVTLVDSKHHVTTTIHNAGPDLDPGRLDELGERLRQHLAPGGWLVLGGSLPPSLDANVYADLIRVAQAGEVHTAVDTEGEPLRAAVSANPELVRMSPASLAELMDAELEEEKDCFASMVELHEAGVGTVVVTPRDGPSLAVNADGRWRVTPPTVPTATLISEVGWTDATLAGVIDVLYRGGEFEAALRRGIAAGRAAMVTPGTQLCEASTVAAFEEQVRIEHLDAADPTG